MPPCKQNFICTWDCTKCCLELPPRAFLYNDVDKARNIPRLQMLQIKIPGRKTKTLKKIPSCEQNPFLYYLKPVLRVPCCKFIGTKIMV